MLDQNTDRMWFVIGAVIVGAAIIFIANGTMPELFANVADTFSNSSEEASGVVEEIGRESNNYIYHDEIQQIIADHYAGENLADLATFSANGNISQYTYDAANGVSTITYSPSDRTKYKGVRPANHDILVNKGDRVTISIEMFTEEDEFIIVDKNNWDNARVISGNDHRVAPKYTALGGQNSYRFTTKGGQWNPIIISYVANDDADVYYEGTRFGPVNDRIYESETQHHFRNARWTVVPNKY